MGDLALEVLPELHERRVHVLLVPSAAAKLDVHMDGLRGRRRGRRGRRRAFSYGLPILVETEFGEHGLLLVGVGERHLWPTLGRQAEGHILEHAQLHVAAVCESGRAEREERGQGVHAAVAQQQDRPLPRQLADLSARLSENGLSDTGA